MGAITDATDEELARYAAAIKAEQDRRRTLDTAVKQVQQISATYLSASGVEPGQAWRQPTSAVDAYPKGWTVQHENREWESLTAGNVWVPGVSGWREVVEDGAEPPEYVAPTGSHDAYQTGDRVTFDGEVYEAVMDGVVWSPADYPQAWKRVDQ